jgi:hypothetical protein
MQIVNMSSFLNCHPFEVIEEDDQRSYFASINAAARTAASRRGWVKGPGGMLMDLAECVRHVAELDFRQKSESISTRQGRWADHLR